MSCDARLAFGGIDLEWGFPCDPGEAFEYQLQALEALFARLTVRPRLGLPAYPLLMTYPSLLMLRDFHSSCSRTLRLCLVGLLAGSCLTPFASAEAATSAIELPAEGQWGLEPMGWLFRKPADVPYVYSLDFGWLYELPGTASWFYSPRADLGWFWSGAPYGTWLFQAGKGWTTVQKIRDAEWLLIWNDEFEIPGAPDPEKWGYEVGRVRNQELQYFTFDRRENAEVVGGDLVIRILKEAYKGSDYTSASLLSRDRGDFLYGRVEIRAKLPKGRGTWPALWMMPSEGIYGAWPKSGEIDILENVGYDPDRVHGTIHTEANNHTLGNQLTASRVLTDPSPSEDYHVYSIDWLPGSLGISVDGVRYFTYRKAPGVDYKKWPFDRHFYLILNAAFGGSWGGSQGVDDSLLPHELRIDYVRVYQQRKDVLNPIRILPEVVIPVAPALPSEGGLAINFGPAEAEPVAGYLADTGLPYGDRGNGQTYGWSNDVSGSSRNRLGGVFPDVRYETLCQMQKSGNAVWEIALANGTYAVTVTMGDASFSDSVYVLDAEGVNLITGTPDYAERWKQGTAEVTVTDGKLTLSSGVGAQNNKICFVHIEPVL